MDVAVIASTVTIVAATAVAITAVAAAVKQRYVPCERLSSWGPFSLFQSRTSEIYGGSSRLVLALSVYQ